MRDSLHTFKLPISAPARIAKGTVVLGTLLACFLSLLAVITVARWFGINPAQLREPNSVFDPRVVATVLAILLVPISIVFAAQRLIHRAAPAELGFRHPRTSALFWGVGSGLVLKLAALAAAFSFSPDAHLLFTTIGVTPLAWAPYFVWYLLLLLLNSFNEELIYRAYAIENTRSIFGPSAWGNVLAASLVFSLMHFLIEAPDWLHFLYRLGFGIVAGLLYIGRRNILLIIGLHTGWNFVALSFSDADWQMGGLVRVSGLRNQSELIANIVVLSLTTVAILNRQRFRVIYQLGKKAFRGATRNSPR
jgi:membrane protease YdiL (CAAX protease family)